jgi:hypothetical protein
MSKADYYRIRFRTGEIVINHETCKGCENYACIKADRLFGTNVLRLQDGRPIAVVGSEDFKRTCNECLACEIYCQLYGNKGLIINLDSFGLDKIKEELR